jgi:hypothetical protein
MKRGIVEVDVDMLMHVMKFPECVVLGVVHHPERNSISFHLSHDDMVDVIQGSHSPTYVPTFSKTEITFDWGEPL